jgi:hypothetical protein
MGRQCTAVLSLDGKRAAGEAHLETDHLLFRGPIRLKVPFGEISALEVRGDVLHVTTARGNAELELGAREAALWSHKIQHPPSLLDKLGIKAADVACVVGIADDEFLEALTARLATPPKRRIVKGAATIFYGADSPRALGRLGALRSALRPDGAIWVVSRKGKGATLRDTEVMAAARTAGLVDTKVASFSPTHTALKLVVPRAARRA